MAEAELGRIKRNVAKMVDSGAPEADIDGYIASEGVSLDQVKAAPYTPKYSKTASGILGAGDAITMGFGDEILAAANAAPHLLDGNYKENYSRHLDNIRAMQGEAQEQNPWSYGGGQVVGSIAGAAGMAKAAPNAARAVSNFVARNPVLGATGVGGAMGGVYGFGSGEGGFGERAESAVEGGLVGAGAGYVGSRVGSAIGDTAHSLLERGKGLFSKPAPVNSIDDILEQGAKSADLPDIDTAGPALKKVSAAIKKDFPTQYNDIFRMWKDGDKSLAEMYGPHTTSLAKGAAQYPSGKAAADKFFDSKITNSPDRFKNAVSRNINPTIDLHTEIEQIVSHGRKNAAPLYDLAYMKNINPEIDVFDPMSNIVSKPEIRQAIAKARRKYPSELEGFDDFSVKTLDYAKRILDDDISSAQRSGEGNFARSRTDLKNQLLNMMDEQVPFYKKAREVSGDYISIKNAAENGMSFRSMDPEILGKTFKGMSNNEKAAFKAGVAKSIRDTVDSTIDGSNPYNRVFGKATDRARLAKVLSPAEYVDIEKSFKAEDRLFKMRNEILGGSPTTSKAIAAAQLANGGAELLDQISTGGISSVPRQAVWSWVRQSFDGLSNDTAKVVSDILYETDPSKKVIMLERLGGKKLLSPAEVKSARSAYFQANSALSSRAKGAMAGGVVFNRPMTNDPQGEAPRPFVQDAQGNQHYYQ